MREALFVKQNVQKWEDFENAPAKDPDELAHRFLQITDDLAYAKTFYPKSRTTAYLNGLAATLHQSIYKNKKEKSIRIVTFWKYELPLVFKKYQKQILYSFIFFSIFTLIGVISVNRDDNFLRIVVGDEYVDMTNANIAKGDPFGVYKDHNEFAMFFFIASNNIYVALLNFVAGIAFSVGAIFFLFKNSVMLGAFVGFFFTKGLGIKSILVVFIHGTLEMSSFVIASAAGLVLGNSLLFPGTYKRIDSVKRGAKDGMKMAIGLAPIFLIAAFFESFVTRHTEMPLWCSLTILLSSLTFIIWYVIIYPNLLYKKQKPYAV